MAMILFVDDDELLHPLVGKVLQDAGHNLVFAADGERAYALARDQPFDLILLDYEMPKMTGIDVLNHLKMMRTGPPPVIMLTARGDAETVQACIRAGARDFIVKPFNVEELLRRVTQHLGEG